MNTESQHPLELEENSEVVEAELTRLLNERRFSGAPQMSAFLKYIVTQTLIGKADRIKAYSVGVDALGKPDSFDAQTDPSVRVLALRLRKTLKTVYASSTDNLAIIELKVGTYVPIFYKPTATYGDDLLLAVEVKGEQAQQASVKLSNPADTDRQSNPVFGGKEAIAIKPLRDQDTARQRSTNIGMPSDVVTQPANGNILKRSCQSIAGDVKMHWPLLDKWWIVAGSIFLLAAWQISVMHTSKNVLSSKSLKTLSATTIYPASSGRSGRTGAGDILAIARPTVPTVYIELSMHQEDLDRQLMVMLSSSLVMAGTVNVVRREQSPVAYESEIWPGEYQLLVNGLVVEGDVHVFTQLVSLFSGEMLFANTMAVDGVDQTFSAQNLLSIESMASGILSPGGPLYSDYCLNAANSIGQHGCPAS